MQVAVTPSATPLLTREAIFKLKEAGLVRLGISLDGSTPEIHDAFRGLPGAWARTIQAIEWANEAGIPIQVHTTISRHNAHDLDNLCTLFEKLAIVMWNVFFLVPVGRGQLGRSAERRGVRAGLWQDLRAVAPGELPDQDHGGDALPPLSAAAQSGRAEDGARARASRRHPDAADAAYEPGAPTADAKTRTMSWATRRVNDGKGFVFISHVGNVYPSGFLPIHAGNIRETPLAARSTATRRSSSRCATPAAGRQVRRVRVQGDLRRFAGAGLRADRRSAGRRSRAASTSRRTGTRS